MLSVLIGVLYIIYSKRQDYDDAKKRNDIEIGFLISSNAASPRRLR